MPDLRHLGPQDRPDPAVLLIDAVINRQLDLARRLSQQLVHRQGVQALDDFLDGTLQATCGQDSVQWLRQHLNEGKSGMPSANAPQPTATPAEQLSSLFQRALDEALAPLRQNQPARFAAEPPEASTSSDPWELQPLQVVDPKPMASKPAPLPADLASLRSWLHSDAA